MTPALGVHDLAHNVSEATVTQLTEEARSRSSIVHSLLNVLQSCSGHKQSQRWRRGIAANVVWRINEVTLRRAGLVLGWVIVFGR